jgi:GTP cyclohydrolase FolE2
MVEISQILGNTLVEFIDYALVIIAVMSFYYGVRIFTSAQTAERTGGGNLIGELQRRGRERRERVQRTTEERRDRRRRSRYLDTAVDIIRRRLIPSGQNARRVLEKIKKEEFKRRDTKKFKDSINKLEKKLNKVRDLLASSQRNLSAERAAQIAGWYAYVESMVQFLSDNVTAHIPDDTQTASDWKAIIPTMMTNLQHVEDMARALWQALDTFVERDAGTTPSPIPTPTNP